MSTDLAALNRITIPYEVNGEVHKFRLYVIDHGTVSLDGYRTIDTRTSFISWAAAVQHFCENFAEFALGTGTAIGTCLYEERDDTLWLPLQTYLPTDLTYGSEAPTLAGQMTLTLRGGAFKQLKIVIMESVYGVPIHTLTIPNNGFFNSWKAAGADPADPINWQVGRDNTYMQEAPYAGFSTDYNRKLRRMRGV